jgi:hypothetical protein
MKEIYSRTGRNGELALPAENCLALVIMKNGTKQSCKYRHDLNKFTFEALDRVSKEKVEVILDPSEIFSWSLETKPKLEKVETKLA